MMHERIFRKSTPNVAYVCVRPRINARVISYMYQIAR